MAQKILFGYILVMSIVAFCVCGADKFAAQRQKSRVPEKVLFLLSALVEVSECILGCLPSGTRPNTGIL